VTVGAIASRIAAEPVEVAAILADERNRGRVRRTDAGGWAIVPSAFTPGVVEALRQLA
jgi:hypothetical protein